MVASQAAESEARVGSLVKSVGQPGAGNPHARLEEGAPVAAAVRPDRALLYNLTRVLFPGMAEALRGVGSVD
jgi:hypothetical protein